MAATPKMPTERVGEALSQTIKEARELETSMTAELEQVEIKRNQLREGIAKVQRVIRVILEEGEFTSKPKPKGGRAAVGRNGDGSKSAAVASKAMKDRVYNWLLMQQEAHTAAEITAALEVSPASVRNAVAALRQETQIRLTGHAQTPGSPALWRAIPLSEQVGKSGNNDDVFAG